MYIFLVGREKLMPECSMPMEAKIHVMRVIIRGIPHYVGKILYSMWDNSNNSLINTWHDFTLLL